MTTVSALTSGPGARRLHLPPAVGPLTEQLFSMLADSPDGLVDLDCGPSSTDVLADDDLQLALYVCYELHYAQFDEVDQRWEWAPDLLRFRAELERQMEDALTEMRPRWDPSDCADVGGTLQRLVSEAPGPSLSRSLETSGSREEFLEFVVHRSAYQLKEADPHSWAIPRLSGGPKAAMLEVQFDEYGSGRAERIHATLFANTMSALGLDPTYGAYLDRLPGLTLATVNMISLFGLHRRLRGALVGQLAVFEMTSPIPNRRYANALRRLGFGVAATDFYDEHVEADAVHESIATWDLADALAKEEPALAAQILFGASALLSVEERWARLLLDAWAGGHSSLSRPLS